MIVGAIIALTGLLWAIPEYGQLYRTWFVLSSTKSTDAVWLTRLSAQVQIHRLNCFAEALGSLAGLFMIVGALLGISIERLRSAPR
jgi:hypothetical protein